MATRVAKVAVDLAANSAQFTSGLGRADAALASSARKWDRHLSAMDAKLAAVGSTMKGLAALAGVGSIGAIMQQASSKAMDFGHAMAEVNTVLADKSSMDTLRAQAQELAKEFGTTATKQAGVLYEILSAGATDAASAMEQWAAANKLAKGGVADVTASADGLTSVMNAYGAAAGSAAEVSDAFFVAVRDGKTRVSDLAANIGEVAPIAAQAGVSLDELLAGAAALTKGGQSTSESMTGLRQIIMAVLKPTKEASETAKALGLEFNATALASKGLSGFLADVANKTGGSTEIMAKLFGSVEALGPVLALTGSQAKDFATSLENMRNKAGETEKAVALMAESPLEKFHHLSAAVDAAMVSIGESINVGAIPAMEDLLALVNQVDAVFAQLKGMDQRSISQLQIGVDNAKSLVTGLRQQLDGLKGGVGGALGDIFSADAKDLFSGNAIGSRRRDIEQEILSLEYFIAQSEGRLKELRGGTVKNGGAAPLSSLKPEARPGTVKAPTLPDEEEGKRSEKIAKQVEQLKFEEAQLSRTAREQAIYTALQQNGLSVTSEAGQRVAELAGRLYDETEAREAATDKATELLGDIKKESEERAKGAKALDEYIAGLQREVSLIGMSANARELSETAMQAENIAREHGIELTDRQRQQITELIAKKQELTAKEDEHKAALQELETFGERAFDRIGSSMTEMAMEGQDAWQSMGNIGKAVMSELLQEMFRLAAINPLKNALFGGNAATLQGVGGLLGSLFGGGWSSPVTTQQPASTTVSGGGWDLRFAQGGQIVGPGTGTSDSILARVSNGEFVVNAESTRKHRALIEAINSDRLPAFASGGMVGSSPALSPSNIGGAGGGYRVVVNNYGDGEVSTRERRTANGGTDLEVMVDKAVAKKLGARNSSSSKALRQQFGARETLVRR